MEYENVPIRKNIIWNSVGTFVMFFCQWLMMVLVVRLSGYADSGILSLSVSCGNVFLIIAAFGIKTFQVSDLKYKYSDSEYAGAKLVTILFTLIVGAVWVLISGYEGIEKLSIVLYMFYIMVYSYADTIYGSLQKKWRLDIAGLSMCIRNIAALIVFCVLIYFTKDIRIALVIMLVSSLAVLFIYDIPASKKKAGIDTGIRFSNVGRLILECFPYAIYTFLHTLLLTVPKLVLRGYFDKETLGIYSAVMAPVAILQVAATFVINPLSTLIAARVDEGRLRELFRIMGKCVAMLAAFLAGGILVSIFLGEFGLTLLYGEEIREYTFLLIPMVIVSVLTAFTILMGNLAVVIRDRLGANISGITGLAAAFAASYILIPAYGMQGASYSFIVALVIQDIILIISTVVKLKKKQ